MSQFQSFNVRPGGGGVISNTQSSARSDTIGNILTYTMPMVAKYLMQQQLDKANNASNLRAIQEAAKINAARNGTQGAQPTQPQPTQPQPTQPVNGANGTTVSPKVNNLPTKQPFNMNYPTGYQPKFNANGPVGKVLDGTEIASLPSDVATVMGTGAGAGAAGGGTIAAQAAPALFSEGTVGLSEIMAQQATAQAAAEAAAQAALAGGTAVAGAGAAGGAGLMGALGGPVGAILGILGPMMMAGGTPKTESIQNQIIKGGVDSKPIGFANGSSMDTGNTFDFNKPSDNSFDSSSNDSFDLKKMLSGRNSINFNQDDWLKMLLAGKGGGF